MAISKDLRDDQGVTLVELLVVITLLGLIGGALVSSLVAGYRTSTFADNRIQAVTDLQQAIEYVGRNTRVADSEGTGLIRPSTATQLDLDVYRDDAATLTRVRYTYTVLPSVEFPGRGRLRETRTVWNDPDNAAAGYGAASTKFLVDGLDTTTNLFSYYDAAGNVTDAVANVANAREVVIQVNRDTRDPNNPGRTIEVETRIALRNPA
jgi:prepilin-type N-terminal cleavage/methylation domain-containing protein